LLPPSSPFRLAALCPNQPRRQRSNFTWLSNRVETIHPKARKRVEVVSDPDPLSLFADGKASSVSLGAACRAGTAAPQHESVSPSVSVCRDTDGAPIAYRSKCLRQARSGWSANRKQPTWMNCDLSPICQCGWTRAVGLRANRRLDGGGTSRGLSFVRVGDDTPLVEDAAFPWLARDTPFGRNCYIFAEGEFLQQRAQ